MRKVNYFTIAALSYTSLAALGCNADSSSPSSPPAENRIVIQTADRSFVSVQPATLKATFGATPLLELGIQGTTGGTVWSTIARPTMNEATEGAMNIALTGGPLAEGVGNLSLNSPNGILDSATSGSFRASISKSRISAEAEATPVALAATIEGDILISCWIPRSSSVGQTAGGTTDPSGSEVLVEDEGLDSPLCQPFKALR